MESKEEDIMYNNLKLIMTLISKKLGDNAQIGRQLAEEKGSILLKRLI